MSSSKKEKDGKEVKKHIGAIHINGRLTLLQRKIANVLLLNAYEDLVNKEEHQISIRILAEFVGFDSNDHQLIKNALETLAKTIIKWNLLDKDGVEEWGISSMLAHAHIREGVCSYSYSIALREKLYNPDLYASINLDVQKRFASGYALAIYENCLRYRTIGVTGWISLEIWRELLGLEEDQYTLFKDFNKRVLKPAIQEINESSDILLDAEYKREKRYVTALKFKIYENSNQLSVLDKKIEIHYGEEIIDNKEVIEYETIISQTDNVESVNKTAINKIKAERKTVAQSRSTKSVELPYLSAEYMEMMLKLFDFRLGLTNIHLIMQHHDLDYLQECLYKIEEENAQQAFDNIGETLLKLLLPNARNQLSDATASVRKMPARRKAQLALPDLSDAQFDNQRQAVNLLAGLKQEFEQLWFDKAWKKLSSVEQHNLKSVFVQEIERDPSKGYSMIRRFYQIEGFKHKAVLALFKRFFRKRYTTGLTERAFTTFAQQRGIDSRSLIKTLEIIAE